MEMENKNISVEIMEKETIFEYNINIIIK